MEIETKLDEDYIFYLGFVSSFLKHIRDKDTYSKCYQWLQKLCTEQCHGIDKKRCRNIYLSQLLLCMQNGTISKEFLRPLNEVDILDASEVFELTVQKIETPAWLEDNDAPTSADPTNADKNNIGRTYLATRTLPAGQGAFAYIAISLEDEEPKWIGGGEGVFDRHMEQKYKEQVPDYEMEKILAKRKDPKEREKVITFYNVLLQNIEDELDEKISAGQNATINGLLEQLEQDLRDRNEFGNLKNLNEKNLRVELMLMLHDRIKTRIYKVTKREELLDEIEKSVMTKSFFETSVTEDDKYQLPAAMWEQAIKKAPNKKHIDKLRDNYPLSIIEKFLELLSNHKEEIAMRMQRRHENIAAQMKKELRREDDKGKKLIEEAQTSCDNAMEILKAVEDVYNKKQEAEERNRKKMELPQSEHSKLYDQMRAALYDTQKCVEDEAARGRALAAQINVMSEQTEMYAKVNEESIRKIEETNMEIMKNIKRLNAGIKLQQERINKVQSTVGRKKAGGSEFDIFL